MLQSKQAGLLGNVLLMIGGVTPGFSMANRKYLSEFGLNMMAEYRILLQQDGLGSLTDSGIHPHIYFICRRPRISIDKASIAISTERISGKFKKHIKGVEIDIPFDVPHQLGTGELCIECEYPNTEFILRDKSGGSVLAGKAALLLGLLGPQFWGHLDLEVLYVGQSFGKDGSRNASERLLNHATLQGIYSEAMRRSPDQDIWMLLCTFEPILLASFDGTSGSLQTSVEEDNAHTKTILEASISEQQRINFTEAALIRYFQPEYNKIFKDTFPNPAHSTYRECYDLDLNMITVEIQTDDLHLNLWSRVVEPNWVHFCTFPLHSREERMYMFDVTRSRDTRDQSPPS